MRRRGCGSPRPASVIDPDWSGFGECLGVFVSPNLSFIGPSRWLAWTALPTMLINLACAQPYSARSYQHVDQEVVWAIVCHEGKRTLRLPEEEWPEHKQHGDYRGPCRATGHVPTPKQGRKDQTATAGVGRKEQLRRSAAEWDAMQTAKMAVDSSVAKVLEEVGPTPAPH